MNFLNQALTYIFTASNWGGRAGLGARILEHLQYTAVAVIASALVAIPIGMIIGHTRRGTFLVVTGVNALRALPTGEGEELLNACIDAKIVVAADAVLESLRDVVGRRPALPEKDADVRKRGDKATFLFLAS